MTPIVALLTAALGTLTSVKGLSVLPADDRTAVVIEVDGPVTIEDFTLTNPARLVVDITGARQSLPRDRFTGVNRGGIRALRVSQFRPEVVRVVLDLEQPVQYVVEQRDGAVRVTFPNPRGAFDPWYAPAAPAPRIDDQPRISVFFKDAPIADVVAHFAEFSGRSIIIASGVTGTINADIRDQPWEDAFEALLVTHGLSAREMESGIIRVDKTENLREREKVEDLVTRTFTIRYANVDSLKPAIEGVLSERGKVTRNSATNTLIVTEASSILEQRIAPLIAQLDQRTPQVTISAKIIFVDRTALEELGIIYDLKDTEGNQLNKIVKGFGDTDFDGVIEPVDVDVVRIGGSSIAALANANDRVASPAIQLLTSLDLGRWQLINFLEALNQLQVTDIQATPMLTTLDNMQASVQVGEETPIRVIDVGGGTGGGVPPRANVQMKNTGIILRVTPHVTGDQVLLDLHAERSNIAAAPSDIGYTFQKQESKTQVLVNNGETAVISGLTIIEKSRVRTGIPILMDLPVLGGLFRKSTEREQKRDLLIMVTPRILRDSEF